MPPYSILYCYTVNHNDFLHHDGSILNFHATPQIIWNGSKFKALCQVFMLLIKAFVNEWLWVVTMYHCMLITKYHWLWTVYYNWRLENTNRCQPTSPSFQSLSCFLQDLCNQLFLWWTNGISMVIVG